MPNRPMQTQGSAVGDVCSDLVLRQRISGKRFADDEDIQQDTFVRALSLADRSSIRNPVHYLMRIAQNLTIDRARRQKRESAALQGLLLSEPNFVSTDPERIVSARQQLERVRAAIDSLPPRCREAFLLHRFELLSYSAIARRMSVSTGSVEKHIAQAMLRIARAMQTPGGE